MDAPPATPPLPQLNTISDLIGGVLMLHERAQNDPEFRRIMANYPEKEVIDARIPFRGTDRDFEFLVNCLVEGMENEKEVEKLKREMDAEKRNYTLRTAPPTSFSYTYSPIFAPPVPHMGPFTAPPQMYMPMNNMLFTEPNTPKIEPFVEDAEVQGLLQRFNSTNMPSTSTAVVPSPYFSPIYPVAPEPQQLAVPKEEDLNLQDEMAYMDQQIDTMAKCHEQEMLNLKLDRLVENRHWEDKIAQIKEDNEKLEGYCVTAELAKAEVEETLEKKEERLRRQVEQQSVKDWKMHEIQMKMEEKDRRIQELEARLSSMETSTSNELEQLRTQLSKMVMDPTEKRKKPRISESQPSSSEGNVGGVTDGWSKVDDSGDVWVYGEEADS